MVAHDPTPSRAEGGAKPWASRSRANALCPRRGRRGLPQGARLGPGPRRSRTPCAAASAPAGGPGASAPGGAGGVHRPFAGGGVTARSTPLGPAGVTRRGPSLRGVGLSPGLGARRPACADRTPDPGAGWALARAPRLRPCAGRAPDSGGWGSGAPGGSGTAPREGPAPRAGGGASPGPCRAPGPCDAHSWSPGCAF